MIARGSRLVIPHATHEAIRSHLFPGDGLEAAALLLCAPVRGRRLKLLVADWIAVPYSACRRRRGSITWPGEFVEAAIERAERDGYSIIALHSHPQGLFAFSLVDDESDKILMPSLASAIERECGSAIMTPNGEVLARLYDASGTASYVDLVMCPGANISIWWNEGKTEGGPLAPPMTFTAGMWRWLKSMSACVIGVSGTGSVIAEQLARLGFGEIILIDFDKIEPRNLNRILNSCLDDAEHNRQKVEMFAEAIRRYRADCDVIAIPSSISAREAIIAASETDVLFSCVDTAEGRHLADRISAFVAMPLFDVGVSIPTIENSDGRRVIADAYGRIDYVFPGGSTLHDRGVYDSALLEAEYLARANPEAFQRKVQDGYLRGIGEQAPGVISLNMQASSLCVLELIARLFPYRHFEPGSRARTVFMLADGDTEYFAESEFSRKSALPVAAGLSEPLLGLPAFATPRQAA